MQSLFLYLNNRMLKNSNREIMDSDLLSGIKNTFMAAIGHLFLFFRRIRKSIFLPAGTIEFSNHFSRVVKTLMNVIRYLFPEDVDVDLLCQTTVYHVQRLRGTHPEKNSCFSEQLRKVLKYSSPSSYTIMTF